MRRQVRRLRDKTQPRFPWEAAAGMHGKSSVDMDIAQLLQFEVCNVRSMLLWRDRCLGTVMLTMLVGVRSSRRPFRCTRCTAGSELPVSWLLLATDASFGFQCCSSATADEDAQLGSSDDGSGCRLLRWLQERWGNVSYGRLLLSSDFWLCRSLTLAPSVDL